MENNPINSLIDLLAVSGHSRVDLHRVVFQSGGHIIIPVELLGFVGGNVAEISTDQHGRIRFRNFIVSPLLSCGHVTRSITEIAGICSVCKRLVCSQCLLTCDFTGDPVCRRHSKIKDGVVVGHHAQKGLWKFKVRRIAMEKELIRYERKQISNK